MTTTRADSPRPEAWQRQILDRGSAIFAVGAFLVVSQIDLASSCLAE